MTNGARTRKALKARPGIKTPKIRVVKTSLAPCVTPSALLPRPVRLPVKFWRVLSSFVMGTWSFFWPKPVSTKTSEKFGRTGRAKK
jgi:hypothetical protein